MLSFKINSVRVEFVFSFFVIVAVASLGSSLRLMTTLLCCVLHELGHLSAMFFFDKKPNAICFYGGGIKIKAPILELDSKREMLVYSAGCTVNLVLYVLSCMAGMGHTAFAVSNLLLCLFNLMPFEHLDGGKITSVLTVSSLSWYNLFKTVRFAVSAVLILAVLKALFIGNISLVTLACVGYLLVSEYLS